MNQLDRFDWAILNELQMDGRLTNAELAQRVGLSAAPCWRRVRALEESGYITGYHATLDRHKLGVSPELRHHQQSAHRHQTHRARSPRQAGKHPCRPG